MHSNQPRILGLIAAAAHLANCLSWSQAQPADRSQFVLLSEVPTNVFVTDRDSVFKGPDGVVVRREGLDRALKSPECRPAKDDAEGNWGAVGGGWQLSVRFPRKAYVAGQPIEGTILLRNVSTNALRYAVAAAGGFPVSWRRPGERNTTREQFPELPGIMSGAGPDVFPRTQLEFRIRVDQAVTNVLGELAISIRTRVPRVDQPGMMELSSGEASIQIARPGDNRGSPK